MKVSVVISAYNEEKKLEDCLKSVKDVASEIIVIDNTSSDKTNQIAKKYTDKVFIHENNVMLNVNKNFGFTKVTGQWILNLDADERVTDELSKEILDLDENMSTNGFLIPRKNILFGKWIRHSIWWPDYQLRLFKKNKGKFEEKHVHELLKLDGEPEKLTFPIEHLNYQTISQFLYKLEHIYTESEVENILKSGKKINWHDALRMPSQDFMKTYFFQQGYKDGLHGLVLSLLQAFYMEVVFAKVWERQGFEEKEISLDEISDEFGALGKETYYWILTEKINRGKSPIKKIINKIKRKTANISK